MNYNNIILQLQALYFCVVDLSNDSFNDRKGPTEIIVQYQKILSLLYCEHPDIFDNLFQIGANELWDHLALHENPVKISSNEECFADLKIYLQVSILDARSKVKILSHSSK